MKKRIERTDGIMTQQPYDEKGRKLSRLCPNPDCSGTLQLEKDTLTGREVWQCDGLVDPNDPSQELQACEFSHIDGEPYNATPEQYVAWAKAHGRWYPGAIEAAVQTL